MSRTISTRLEEDEIKILNEISEKEHIDRSSLLRKFILTQLQTYKMKEVSEYYRKGLVSLQEAATQANVSIYQMMDYISHENIHPPSQTREEIENDIKRSQRIFEKLKN